MNGWNFDPLELSILALVAALYWRRVRTLARRGQPAPPLRMVAFAGGLLTLFVALASPIDTIGEERLFSMHMFQHLLLGDVAALLGETDSFAFECFGVGFGWMGHRIPRFLGK